MYHLKSIGLILLSVRLFSLHKGKNLSTCSVVISCTKKRTEYVLYHEVDNNIYDEMISLTTNEAAIRHYHRLIIGKLQLNLKALLSNGYYSIIIDNEFIHLDHEEDT